jgi:2-iminoacetate synthase
LSTEEAAREAKILASRGLHRVLVLSGESPKSKFLDNFCKCVEAIKKVDEIKWVGIELASLSLKSCKKLLDSGSDALIVFQETYDKDAYKRFHPRPGPKSIFEGRYECLDIAIQAGFKEVGLGVLYGLSEPIAETEAMISHAKQIQSNHPDISIRCSFPRLMPALNAPLIKSPFKVTRSQLASAIIKTRIELPKSSLVLTARESLKFRLAMLGIVTEFGAGGSTKVGGYGIYPDDDDEKQFTLCDSTPTETFVKHLINRGYEPA